MVGFLKKVLGGNNEGEQPDAKKRKKSGFYLELDEEQGIWVPNEGESKKEPEQQQKAAEVKQPSAPAQSVPSEVKQPSAPAQSVPSAADNNGKSDRPTPEPQPEVTFAPDYLLPKPSPGRRRPGPSMNPFRDMARQSKTPPRS